MSEIKKQNSYHSTAVNALSEKYGLTGHYIRMCLPGERKSIIPDIIKLFVAGSTIFWAKERSEVEIINDYNRELIHFYEGVQNNFIEFYKRVKICL